MNVIWDCLAGLSTAGLLLPEGVAYALIAGVAPAHAIIAALCGLVVYSALGKSRFAVIAPTSSSAAILAAAVGSMTLETGEQRLAALSALVLLTGLMFLIVSVLRLGNLSGFVSRPVLHGFSFGLAITIVIKQMPLIFGVEGLSGSVGAVSFGIWRHLADWNLPSMAIGLSSIILLLLLKQVRALPAAVIVLALGTSLAFYMNLSSYGVKLLGMIQFDAVRPALPSLSSREWLRLIELAPPLVLIVFAESWGSIRTLSLAHNDTVNANRELAALGAANVVSGLFQGLAVGSGFSASSANEAAGACSRFAGLFAAFSLAALMLFALPALAYLPEPVLAAIVVSALTHALNPQPLLRLWKIDRDQYVALAAALCVLAFGVLVGMIGAIILSLLALIKRLTSATITQLGRLGDSHDYVDISRFPEAVCDPEIMILRPSQPIFFASAETVLGAIRDQITKSSPNTLIISFEESSDLDSTALDCLAEFKRQMDHLEVDVYFARVRQKISDAILKYDGGLLADASHQTQSVADAYTAARNANGLRTLQK